MVAATADREIPKLKTEVRSQEAAPTELKLCLRAADFGLWYGDRQALRRTSTSTARRPSLALPAAASPPFCARSTA